MLIPSLFPSEPLLEAVEIYIGDKDAASLLSRSVLYSQEYKMAQGQREDGFTLTIDRLLPSAETLGTAKRRVRKNIFCYSVLSIYVRGALLLIVKFIINVLFVML